MRHDRLLLAVALGVLGGCPSAKPAPDTAASKAAPARALTPADEPIAEGEAQLCVDLEDLQEEPVDFDRLVADTPKLDLGNRAQVYEPDSAIAFGNGGAFAQFKCRDGDCKAYMATVGGRSVPLPGIDTIPGTHTLLYDAALADINSDGADDLWVSYIPTRVTDGDAPADLDTVGRIAAYSLPDLVLQVHLIDFDRSDPDRPCEAAVYAVDADCDGAGDVVHVIRCGDAQCFGDDAPDIPACVNAVRVVRDVYLWSQTLGTYRRAGSNP